METIMASGHMGTFNLGRNGSFASNSCRVPSSSSGFLIYRKPHFNFALKTKTSNHVWILCVRTPNCRSVNALPKKETENSLMGGGFLEKEFKFEPTFDEYLKVMETVRVGRDKNPTRDVGGYHSEKKSLGEDSASTPGPSVCGEDADLSGPHSNSNRVKNVNAAERSRGGKNGKIRYSKGNTHLANELSDNDKGRRHQIQNSSNKVSGRDRSQFGEREVDLKNDKRLGPYKKYGDNRGEGNGEYLGKKAIGYDAKYSKVRKELQQNGGWTRSLVSNVENKINESRCSKSMDYVRRRSGYENFDIDKKRMPHELEINDKEQRTYADDIGKDFRNRYRSQNSVRLLEDSVEVEKLGTKGTGIPEGLRKNYIHEGKGGGYNISLENEKVRRTNLVFKEDDNGNDLFMERKAFKSFEVFTDVRGRPHVLRMEMEERIEKLAKWLNGTDVDMPEWQFSKMMHSAKIRFTDHTILRVVQILGSLGNWRRVLQVVQWLQSRDRFKSLKSRYIYTTVINVLGKAKRAVEALNVFYAMRQEFLSYPDLATYHSIAVTLGQAGLMKELFDVIDCMRALPPKKFKTGMIEKWDPRLEPDAVVYNAVLNACVQRKQWEGAFWVLQQLKQQHIQPSSTTYGLVMEVMFACGKYSLVHEFFRKVEKTSVPSTLNYKVLVNTLWREGKTDEAVLAVKDMEGRGIVGSASLYYDLARCLCSAGRCQEALQQIDKVCKVAKKPLVVTYTGLIQACLDSGSVQNGAHIFSQMHNFCSPNIVTCNIMLKAYIEHKMFEEAKDLFQKILDGTRYLCSISDYKNCVIPDKFTFNTMLEACIEEKRWDDFENFYRRMLHHGYHFNPKRHQWMIMEASRAGKGQSLDTTWNYLIRSGRTAPASIIKERFRVKLQEDDITTALSCIGSDQMSSPQGFSEKAWLDFLNGNANRIGKDTLIRLVDEVNTLISKSDQPNPIHQNLVSSCREFFRARADATGPSTNALTPI